MTQEIKNKLMELRDAANNICYELWKISENESLTQEQRNEISSYAIDADQLAINIKQL